MTTEEVYNRILQNLPPFVKINGTLGMVIQTIARRLSDLSVANDSLTDEGFTGKGLLLNADNSLIFRHRDRAVEDIETDIGRKLSVYEKRGTASGIRSDLDALLGESLFTRASLGEGGWTVDSTYPEDSSVFIDSLKVCNIELNLNGRRITPQEKRIIESYIVPLDFTITYTYA